MTAALGLASPLALVGELQRKDRALKRLQFEMLEIVAALDQHGAAETLGYQDLVEVFKHTMCWDPKTTRRKLKQAQALCPTLTPTGAMLAPALPLVAAAMAALPVAAEEPVVEYARLHEPRSAKAFCRELVYRLDQDGPEPAEPEPVRPRNVLRRRWQGGRYQLFADLDAATGAKLDALLDPLTKPEPDDVRFAPEREGDALCEIIDLALRADRYPGLDGRSHGGEGVQLTVTVDFDKLRADIGTARLDNGEHIPMQLGSRSQIYDIGRKTRTINADPAATSSTPHKCRAVTHGAAAAVGSRRSTVESTPHAIPLYRKSRNRFRAGTFSGTSMRALSYAAAAARAPLGEHMDQDVPHLDTTLPIDARVAGLLAQMTLPEKVGQMMQLDSREDLDDHVLSKHVGSILHTSPERVLRAHDLTSRTRLRIPLLIAEDCIHGHSFHEGATIFPTQLGMAATWDPALVEQVARVTAVEAAATGVHWTFSPVLCIARDLRWGRIDETFGEDPVLIGELAAAMVRGYQGDGLADPTAILATAKHFAGYSETQGGRDATEADLSRRKLRSWFLPPFERVARAGCATFMLGYQSTDGVPITVNSWLLDEVLRGEWGYRGTLITDWDNVGRMVWEQRLQPDYAHAAAAAVKAGNDMIMTTPQFFEGALQAVEDGLLAESDLDRAVTRILTLKFELGLFENPRRPDTERQRTIINHADHAALNLDVARRSVVLLRNDGVLPLGQGPKIAVVGPLADDAQTQLGDWAGSSGQADWLPDGQPRDMITTVLDGLRAISPDVTYAQGAGILTLEADPAGETFPDGQPRPQIVAPCPPDEALIAEAVAAARDADYVVAVVGDRIELVGEGRSTATLDLIGGQIALLDALAETGTPLIVVLLASKPLVLPQSARDAAAVLWVANPGMQGGRAIAEILHGLVEPSGRLPISFAGHVGQQPTYYNQIRGQHGTRYADHTQEPAFAFGEGLSYTTVEYGELRVESAVLHPDETVQATITLTNTGARPARETVQVYVSDAVTSVSWADKELKAFKQVDLAPGETATVRLEVPVADCSIVDAQGCRVVEPGEFVLLVGPSSKAEVLRRAEFTVKQVL